MATQAQIDALLHDSWEGESSEANISAKKAKQKVSEDEYSYDKQSFASLSKAFEKSQKPAKQESNYESYGHEQFDEYEQSRRTQSYQQSESEQFSRPRNKSKDKKIEKAQSNAGKAKPLAPIKQEQVSGKRQSFQHQQIYIKPALDLNDQTGFTRKQSSSTAKDKTHPPHNYARLQERERQLLFTALSEQNKRLKAELNEKNISFKKIETKYKMLLEEKGENNATAKQMALEKKIAMLKTKLEQMANLKKITEDREKYKTKLGKNPGSFIPEEEASRREQELLDLIDKLKQRLLENDQSMGVLQRKLSQGVEHNDELHRKMKRVEQLEYKIEKMTEQAETDRSYIQILKQKLKQSERQVENERSRYRKLEIENKRLQMGQLTHSDIMKELEETRRQKQLLEKSLKEMSATMITNVRSNYRNPNAEEIQDSNELLKPNPASNSSVNNAAEGKNKKEGISVKFK